MKGTHPQSYVTPRYRGYVTHEKRYISTFTSPMDHKLSKLVSQLVKGSHSKSHVTYRQCGHGTNKKRSISTFTSPWSQKLGRVLTQDEEGPPKKSCDTLISQPHEKSNGSYFWSRGGHIFTFTCSCSVALAIDGLTSLKNLQIT